MPEIVKIFWLTPSVAPAVARLRSAISQLACHGLGDHGDQPLVVLGENILLVSRKREIGHRITDRVRDLGWIESPRLTTDPHLQRDLVDRLPLDKARPIVAGLFFLGCGGVALQEAVLFDEIAGNHDKTVSNAVVGCGGFVFCLAGRVLVTSSLKTKGKKRKIHRASGLSEIVVVRAGQDRRFLIFGDFLLEEIGLLLQIHSLRKPG